ncbi:MAG TPA: DUF4252 domain-containing protein [Pyrinomonadaceae bacterium]|jgi:hypothetical protein
MKSIVNAFVRITVASLLIALVSIASQAQTAAAAAADTSGKLQIAQLDRLASKAAEFINVNMDERLLRLVPSVLSNDPEEKDVKEVIAGLRGIYVKRFEFDNEGAYGAGDLEAIRAQLSPPNWSRIVEIRSRRDGENIEVYLLTNGGRVDGLVVLSSEPKELMVINIVGSIDLDKLAKLRGQFGVPEDLEYETKPRTKRQ